MLKKMIFLQAKIISGMKHILTILLTFLFCINIFSQSQGYFQFRGRVYDKGKGVEGASIKVYLNNSLISSSTSQQLGKFTLKFDLNKYFVVEIARNNRFRTVIVNTKVPRYEQKKALDSYEVVNLVEKDKNDLLRLLFSYNYKQRKFVMYDAPKNMQNYEHQTIEPTISDLQNQVSYLKKLLSGYEDLKKYSETAKDPKGLINPKNRDSDYVSHVIKTVAKDSAYISKIIKNSGTNDSIFDFLDQYVLPDKSIKNNKDIRQLKKELKEIEQTELDSQQKDIKIQEKKIEIIGKAINLSQQRLKLDGQRVLSDSERVKLKKRISELVHFEKAAEQVKFELNQAKHEIKNKELELANERIIRWFLIFIIFVTIVSLILARIIYKDKKKTSIKLEAQNRELEKLSIVASETTNAIVITDRKGDFSWVNKGYNKLFEHENIQHVKQNIFNMGYDKAVYDKIREAVNTGKATEYITQVKLSSGKLIWVQASVTPILNKLRKVSKLVIIYSDITEVQEAKRKISRQNQQIMDSITYAKRIQDATLPSEALFKSYFPNSFIYFKPRDVVSGDFYWLSVQEDKLFVAAVDCTGHGVPGAFMSLIGNSLLNNIVNERKIFDTADILKELNKGVLKALSQREYNKQMMSSDGMDLTICRFDKNSEAIQIALANHHAVIIDDKQNIVDIAGDDISIGDILLNNREVKFTNHTVNYKKGYTIYLFSDGYHDQLGGDKYKKMLMKNFKTILQDNNAANMSSVADNLNAKLKDWKGNYGQTDDILVMGIRL